MQGLSTSGIYHFIMYVSVCTQLTCTAASKWERYTATTCLCFLSQSCKKEKKYHHVKIQYLIYIQVIHKRHFSLINSHLSSPVVVGRVWKSCSAGPSVVPGYHAA